MYIPNDCSFLSEIPTTAKLSFFRKEESRDDTTVNPLLSPSVVSLSQAYFIEGGGGGGAGGLFNLLKCQYTTHIVW